MDLEALKNKLPDLHNAKTAEAIKEVSVEEDAPSSKNDFDLAEDEVKQRIINHIFSAKTEKELDNLYEILTEESGYEDEFDIYFELKRNQVKVEIENFDNYLFHPHMVGLLMAGLPKPLTERQEKMLADYTARNNGEGRKLTEKQLADLGDLLGRKNAKPKLTVGAKNKLQEVFWNTITGRSNQLEVKYLDKGIICEDKTIQLYEKVTGGIFLKNKTRKQNDYFNGECDNRQGGVIRDVKTSWEYNSFPANEDEIPSSLYEWQLDAYMDLYEMKEAELIYGLVDTPFKLINDELRRKDMKHNILTVDGEVREDAIDFVVEFVSNHIFSNEGLIKFCEESSIIHLKWFSGRFTEIPETNRIKVFKHSYCEKRNKQLKQMLDLSREYLNQLLNQYKR
tara:strand:+ start:264 stop:1448 length:1185 start_codon:yes stop_codon:yes gene_type:complete